MRMKMNDMSTQCRPAIMGYKDNLTPNQPRCFVMHFDSLMHLDWSTQFGDIPSNYSDCVSSEGEFIFLGGYSLSNYTLLEYDEGNDADYYDATLAGFDQDATITRFKLPQYVGVEELAKMHLEYALLLYPNPSSDHLNVLLPIQAEIGDRIELFDIRGRQISSTRLGNSVKSFFMNTELLPQGVYSVRFVTSTQTMSSLFVKI